MNMHRYHGVREGGDCPRWRRKEEEEEEETTYGKEHWLAFDIATDEFVLVLVGGKGNVDDNLID